MQDLAFYGVNTQSVIQSFLKTPVCGASLSHIIWQLICRFFVEKIYARLQTLKFAEQKHVSCVLNL